MKESQAQIIESLDSLWFFSNVFSSNSTTNPKIQFLEDPKKPILPILNSDQNEKIAVETEPKITVPILQIGNEEEEEEEAEVNLNPVKKLEEKMKISKRKKKGEKRRKILGEIDLGIDLVWRINAEVNNNNPNHQDLVVKMPSLSDGMAMKQHLKSWAYAVACTVR